MNVHDIVAAIEKLPLEDLERVRKFVREIISERRHQKITEEFKTVADETFTKNAELFRKLAD